MDEILTLFHHIHHQKGKHEVHHCGGAHIKVDPKLTYTITHCPCGKHSINQEEAVGHYTNQNLDSQEIQIKFIEKCPQGGWHIEGGILG